MILHSPSPRDQHLTRSSFALCLLLTAGLAQAVVVPAGVTQRFPGVVVNEWQGHVLSFGGVPMTSGVSARDAAENFIDQHALDFGAGQLELVLSRSDELDFGRQTVFVYDQFLEGVPVEFGTLRVVVLNRMENGAMTHRVSAASAKLARRPGAPLPTATLTAKDALGRVQAMHEYAALPAWSTPTPAVFFGESDMPVWTDPVRAWKFTGRDANPAFPRAFTFFVNASTGELITARNDILNVNITGTIQALATPGSTADHAGNPPVQTNIPEVQVYVQGTGNPGTSVFTDASGNFTIPWAGATPVTLEVRLRRNGASGNGGGRWTDIIQSPDAVAPAPEIAVTQSVTPGTPATINLNPASSHDHV